MKPNNAKFYALLRELRTCPRSTAPMRIKNIFLNTLKQNPIQGGALQPCARTGSPSRHCRYQLRLSLVKNVN